VHQETTTLVHVWWYALCAIAVVNLGIWTFSTRSFLRRRTGADLITHRWPHVLLSGGYVLGCAFRSVLPRADVQRIVVYDSWLSSVLVGRSVATIAELCFAAQWALLLRELSRDQEHPIGDILSRVVLPLIVVAEVFSWYAVLTTSYLGNTLEQSLWTCTVILLVVALFPLWRKAEGPLRSFLSTSLVLSVSFVAFMCLVDVPMYFTRWLADEAAGRTYLTLAQGLHDVSTRWVVTHDLREWREEIAWMTLYFSFAVWFSIAMVHTPRALRRQALSLGVRSRHRSQELSAPAE
jgi:hypothetical protein